MEKQTPTFISNFTRISGVLSNEHPALFALNLESLMKLLVFVLSLKKTELRVYSLFLYTNSSLFGMFTSPEHPVHIVIKINTVTFSSDFVHKALSNEQTTFITSGIVISKTLQTKLCIL